jgi:hypothetical protein
MTFPRINYMYTTNSDHFREFFKPLKTIISLNVLDGFRNFGNSKFKKRAKVLLYFSRQKDYLSLYSLFFCGGVKSGTSFLGLKLRF